MGCMVFGEDRFFNSLMGRMGQRVVEGMVLCILQMTIPIHAGPLFGRDRFSCLLFRGRVSG